MSIPTGAIDEADADCWIIVDPIDGTRGLMYQKRSAWMLTGRRAQSRPGDVVARHRAGRADRDPAGQAAPVRSVVGGAGRRRAGSSLQPADRRTAADPTEPSRGDEHRSRLRDHHSLFPGARDELAAIDEAIVCGALGPHAAGKAHCFEDQYASTGGQLYELIAGHDRFVADLRPLLASRAGRTRAASGLCCHPYDICCGADRGGERRDRDRSRTVGRSMRR